MLPDLLAANSTVLLELLNVYIDGIPDGTANLPADYDLSGTSQHNAYIGVVTDNSTGAREKYLVGSVDDVRIYDRVVVP